MDTLPGMDFFFNNRWYSRNGELFDPSAKVAGGVTNKGRRLAMLGDSLTAYGSDMIAATATVDSNLIATVTCNAHGLLPGKPFAIHKSTDGAYNGVWRVISVPDKNTLTFQMYRVPTVFTMSGLEVNPFRGTTSQSWWGWMNAMLDSPFDVVVNAATGGNTTGNALARLDTDVLAFEPDFCTVLVGTNDLRYNQTAAARDEALANIKEICNRLLARHCTPILCTVLPVGSGDGGFATVMPLMLTLNDGIRSYAMATPGVILSDTYSALVDNTQVDNRAISTALADTVHVNAIGAKMIADRVAADVRKFAPAPRPLVASSGDNRVANASSKNRLNNPLFIRPNGQLQGVAGNANVPEQWNVTSTGATVTPTIEPRTIANDGDTCGNNLKVVAASTAAGQQAVVRTMQSISSFDELDEVFADFALRLEGATNVQYMSMDAYMGMNGSVYHAYWNSGGSYGFPNAQMPFKGVVRMGPLTVQPGGQTTAVIAITIQFSGAGGVTLYLGRPSFAARDE